MGNDLTGKSLGGVESPITYPMLQTHAAVPEEIRNRIGLKLNVKHKLVA